MDHQRIQVLGQRCESSSRCSLRSHGPCVGPPCVRVVSMPEEDVDMTVKGGAGHGSMGEVAGRAQRLRCQPESGRHEDCYEHMCFIFAQMGWRWWMISLCLPCSEEFRLDRRGLCNPRVALWRLSTLPSSPPPHSSTHPRGKRRGDPQGSCWSPHYYVFPGPVSPPLFPGSSFPSQGPSARVRKSRRVTELGLPL